jgi:hypothetical protein
VETLKHIDSFPDATGRFTRLTVNLSGCTLHSIESLLDDKGGQMDEPPTFLSSFAPRSLFQVDFRPLKLAHPQDGAPYWEGGMRSFEAEAGGMPIEPPQENEPDAQPRFLVLKYTAKEPGSTDGDGIAVTVTFRAYNRPKDLGWIRMEISHEYPEGIAGGGELAWESSVVFPRVGYAKGAMEQFSILNSTGFTWDLFAASRDVAGPERKLHPESSLLVQMLAWCKRYAWAERNTSPRRLDSVIIHGTDAQGYRKVAGYYPKGMGPGQPDVPDPDMPDERDTDIYLKLTAPVFLKGGEYTCADRFLMAPLQSSDDEDDAAFKARKSGYGGAVMDYRIRAMVHVAEDSNDPLDWHQIADVYKEWLDKGEPHYWKKAARTGLNAPLDQMAPLTLISNYSLLGAVQKPPSDAPQDYKRMHALQLIYPVGTTGTTTMGGRLVSIKKWFNFGNADGLLKLENQIWGWERGGYYELLGSLTPAWDTLNENTSTLHDMVAALRDLEIWTSITTDPTLPRFGGLRYNGHFRPGQEMQDTGGDNRFWFKYPFPGEFADPELKLEYRNADQVQAARTYQLNFIKEGGVPSAARALRDNFLNLETPDIQESLPLRPNRGVFGLRSICFSRYRLCPVDEVMRMYREDWLGNGLVPLIGNQLLEFMLHNYNIAQCYRTDHHHVPSGLESTLFDAVIGHGPWYIARLRKMMDDAAAAYQGENSFAITNEFAPVELMVDKFHEFYDHFDFPPFGAANADFTSRSLREQNGNTNTFNQLLFFPFIAYLYSGKLPCRMSVGRAAPHAHPGYRLRLKKPNERKERGAWRFAGGYVKANLPSGPATLRAFTLEAWILPDARENVMTVFRLGTDRNLQMVVTLRPAAGTSFELEVKLRNVVLSQLTVTVPAQSWTHIAYVGKPSTGKCLVQVYVNGIVGKSELAPGGPQATTLRVGANTNSTDSRYYGLMDEVRLWKVARTHRDIAKHMYPFLPGTGTQPIIHLAMDIEPTAAQVSFERTHFDVPQDVPTYMLNPIRDEATGIPNFWMWRYVCEAFASHYYKVTNTGISPQGLLTASGSVYSYNRAAEDLFNLRFQIFRICRIAVLGRRVFVSAYQFEEPRNINAPMLKVARAAVQMQYALADVFIHGRMIGETLIVNGNRVIATWLSPWRSFHDIPRFMADVNGKLQLLGDEAPPLEDVYVFDASSSMLDTDNPRPYNGNDATPAVRPIRVFQDQILHHAWEGPRTAEDIPGDAYYVFANAGNSPRTVEFKTYRGMVAGQSYAFTATEYDSEATAANYPVVERGTVVCPNPVTIVIKPRSFKVVSFLPV